MAELDHNTRSERVGKLIQELRGWHPGVPEATLEDLAERFELPELVVRRIADSEGFELAPADEAPRRSVDPNSTTQPIEVDLGDG